MRKADFPPTQPPCKRLSVRKDIKCMTESEITEFVRVIRQLYLNGVMDRIADVHQKYWPETHKAAEFAPFHRWINHELEKEMRKICPGITLPYYVSLKSLGLSKNLEKSLILIKTQSPHEERAHPEKSIVWQILGTSGVHNTGYCLTDGLYAGLKTNRCIKREWNENGTIPVIDGPEHHTFWMQNAKTYNESTGLIGGNHFVPHLAFGGYRGDMSVDTAPFE